MGLIDYMSRNPVGLAISPSEYDEDFVVILNNLANRNKASHELIKKRAKNEGLFIAASNIQVTTKPSKPSATGHFQTINRNQFHSKPAKKQTTLSQLENQQNQKNSYHTNCKKSVHIVSISKSKTEIESHNRNKGFKGGFNPWELKTNESWDRKESEKNWQGSSDSEESLSDPR